VNSRNTDALIKRATAQALEVDGEPEGVSASPDEATKSHGGSRGSHGGKDTID
jgi:hypothetical protein